MTRLAAASCAIALVVGLLLIGSSVRHDDVLAARAEQLAARGEPVPATVVGVRFTKLDRQLVVRYELDGESRESTLRRSRPAGRYPRVGEPTTVYVDATEPSRMATADGYATVGAWSAGLSTILLVAGIVLGGGAGALVVTALADRRGRRSPHPDPSQPSDRYDLWTRLQAGTDAAGAPAKSAWDVAYQRLDLEVVKQRRRRRHSPVQLVVTFQLSGAGAEPAFSTGARVESYQRQPARIHVTVRLPARPTGDGYQLLVRMLRESVDRCRSYLLAEGAGQDLTWLRRLIDQLPDAGADRR